MADAREVVYNELERMLYTMFELGRAYESESRDDMDAVHLAIKNCMSWAKSEKVVNVRVVTKMVRSEDNE